jgi:hypothetical protein
LEIDFTLSNLKNKWKSKSNKLNKNLSFLIKLFLTPPGKLLFFPLLMISDSLVLKMAKLVK